MLARGNNLALRRVCGQRWFLSMGDTIGTPARVWPCTSEMRSGLVVSLEPDVCGCPEWISITGADEWEAVTYTWTSRLTYYLARPAKRSHFKSAPRSMMMVNASPRRLVVEAAPQASWDLGKNSLGQLAKHYGLDSGPRVSLLQLVKSLMAVIVPKMTPVQMVQALQTRFQFFDAYNGLMVSSDSSHHGVAGREAEAPPQCEAGGGEEVEFQELLRARMASPMARRWLEPRGCASVGAIADSHLPGLDHFPLPIRLLAERTARLPVVEFLGLRPRHSGLARGAVVLV